MNQYITEQYHNWLWGKWAEDHWTMDKISRFLRRDRFLIEKDIDNVLGRRVVSLLRRDPKD